MNDRESEFYQQAGFMQQLSQEQLMALSEDERLAYQLQQEELAYAQEPDDQMNDSMAAFNQEESDFSYADYHQSVDGPDNQSTRSSQQQIDSDEASTQRDNILKQIIENMQNNQRHGSGNGSYPSGEDAGFGQEPEVRPPDSASQPYSLIHDADQPQRPQGPGADAAGSNQNAQAQESRNQRRARRRTDQEREQADQRRIRMYFWAIGITLMIITPYNECPGQRPHLINEKTWLLVYFFICFINFLREGVSKKIDSMYNQGQLTYRQKKYCKISLWLSGELLNIIWQVYGNIIYYTKESNEIDICKKTKNTSFFFTMYLMLLIGYMYAMIYLSFLCLYIYIKWRRVNNNRSRQSETTRVMQSITRMPFSEEMFGAISEENECIICLTPFGPNDMITKLDCPGQHFYHTSCIENWIQQGNSRCPICRQDFTGSGQNELEQVEQREEVEAAGA